MNTPIPIDVSKARNNFFNLVDDVYLRDAAYLIKKAGIPVAEIRQVKTNTNPGIMSFAGAFNNTSSQKKINDVYKARLDKKGSSRHLPKLI